jgi:integrase
LEREENIANHCRGERCRRLPFCRAVEMTVSDVIQRVIEKMAEPHMRRHGNTHLYSLKAIQRRPLGKRRPESICEEDIIDYCEARRKDGVCAATVNQDVTYLSGVFKYARSAWKEGREGAAKVLVAIETARPFLVKHELIGKSAPRKRVPTDEEVAKLLAYYEAHPGRVLRMPDVIAFGLASTRRRGEICRLMHGDIDWNRKDAAGNPTPMYLIRDLKHPTKKVGNHKSFPLFPELAEIIRRQPRLRPADPTERVFPFSPESVSQSYIAAKKACGIENLRLHDNRRAAITMWLARLKSPHKVKQISGHETTAILERVYDATDPALLHGELARLEART